MPICNAAEEYGNCGELKKLNVDSLQEQLLQSEDHHDAAKEILDLIDRAHLLSKPVVTKSDINGKCMRELYKSRCWFFRHNSLPGRPYQDFAEMTAQACAQLDARICDFVMRRHEINENTKGQYPHLWEIKNRSHDAVLNGLPKMPTSPEQLMKMLRDTRGEAGVPLGRLPTQEEF